MKNRFLPRLLALLLALVLLLSLVAPVMADSANGVVIKLHYTRPDGEYADWSVWFWNFGQEGVDVPFAEENGDMVATFSVAPGATKVGFIVKLPNWAAKDVNEDQFIDVAAYTSGTIHVYVESGVKGYELVLDEQPQAPTEPPATEEPTDAPTAEPTEPTAPTDEPKPGTDYTPAIAVSVLVVLAGAAFFFLRKKK